MNIKLHNLCIFTMLGTLLFVLKLVMEPLPNIHLTTMLIMVYTVVFRAKAIIPLYVFVSISLIEALVIGNVLWWPPYLYIWLFPYFATLLIPKSLNKKALIAVYMCACALHGFLYGTLYSPAQALIFGMNFKATCSWIIAGLPFDAIHGISNFFAGSLVYPLSKALASACKQN